MVPRYRKIRKTTMHENELPRYEQIRKLTVHKTMLHRHLPD